MKAYDEDLKKKIVRLHIEENRSLRSLAAEYDVSKAIISVWLKKYREECQNKPELKNEYEIRQFFSPEGCTITEKDGTETEGGKLLPSAYFELEMKKGESVKITGGGYGHGVGMSQTAANVMAEEGYDYRIILDYFFKNITIENLG